MQFHVRIPVQTWRELKHRAIEQRTSLDDEVVAAVERDLARQRAHDAALRARGEAQ